MWTYNGRTLRNGRSWTDDSNALIRILGGYGQKQLN